MGYSLYSDFDIEQHKKTFIHYLEVVIDEDGKIIYAVPSHQEKLIALACKRLNITREELNAMCPEEYYCDFMDWLCKISGACAVWENFIQADKLTDNQIKALQMLKDNGLYLGKIPCMGDCTESARLMDIKEFAKSISGKEYGHPQFTKEEIETAKENGFVIVYGCSDDLMEFDGAIRDEGYCYLGGKVYFNKTGISKGGMHIDQNMINAIWDRDCDENGNIITWTYETKILHETFMIYEDGEPYCRGIVFRIEDVR